MIELSNNWIDRYADIPQYILQGERPGFRWDGQLNIERQMQAGSDKKVFRVRISTELPARSNDIIVTQGIDTHFWEQNPVVLWAHDRTFGTSTPPIATGANVAKSVDAAGKGVLEADAIFHELTDLSRDVAALVDAKVIRTVSIGAIPLEWEDSGIGAEEKRDGAIYPSWDNELRRYTKCEMYEFSFCNVPLDPRALVQNSMGTEFGHDIRAAIQRGIIAADGAFIQRIGNGRAIVPAGIAIERSGKVISSANLQKLCTAQEHLADVIASATPANEENSMTTENKTPAANAVEHAAEPTVADLARQVQDLKATVETLAGKIESAATPAAPPVKFAVKKSDIDKALAPES